MKAASAAAGQYKQQAQETGRDFDSFKQQVCVYGTSDSHSCMRVDETALSVCCHPSMPCFGHPDTYMLNAKAGVSAPGDDTGGQPACMPGQHAVITWGQHQL